MERAFGGTPKPKEPAKEAQKEPEKPTEKPSDTDKAAADKEAKPEDKPAEPKADAPPAETFRSAKEMRQAIENRDKKLAALQSERDKATTDLAALQTRVQELEGTGSGDVKALSESVAKYEARVKQLETIISERDYAQAPEFEQRFKKPYERAALKAFSDVEQLSVTVDGTERKATRKDMEALIGMDPFQARRLAKQVFGEDSDIVLAHLAKLHDIRDQSMAALEEHRATWQEKQKAQEAESARFRAFASEKWPVINSEFAKQQPDIFAPDDEQEKQLLGEGFAYVDQGIAQRASLPPKDQMVFDATVRHRIAGFPVLKHQRDAALKRVEELTAEKDSEIEALRKEVAELRGGGPGPGTREGGAKPTDADELAELERKLELGWNKG